MLQRSDTATYHIQSHLVILRLGHKARPESQTLVRLAQQHNRLISKLSNLFVPIPVELFQRGDLFLGCRKRFIYELDRNDGLTVFRGYELGCEDRDGGKGASDGGRVAEPAYSAGLSPGIVVGNQSRWRCTQIRYILRIIEAATRSKAHSTLVLPRLE